ncbi:uncharacterized protein TRUGW13939_05879 [Talaromyces rugulosus]|uniref:BZIP domain-containing protein n=1 Tax=Talaromyces rugulosus TaxID=121627 RepID=A0A7H8QXA8_TALRU|nr:uncharacterized protein TRUGW13939_05879 [Talaromyces rugulosus]QKX58752.1 hypothetical protein TRUGW13939_05879 [Talaromyces rugulosus]
MDGPDSRLLELLSACRYPSAGEDDIVNGQEDSDSPVDKDSCTVTRIIAEQEISRRPSVDMPRRRSTRRAGRPRLDAAGAAVLSEGRRMQVRHAQRTYRRKKEITTQKTKAHLTELEEKLVRISESFTALYDAVFQSDCSNNHAALVSHLEEIRGLLAPESQRPATIFQTVKTREKTLLQSQTDIPYGSDKSSDVIFGYTTLEKPTRKSLDQTMQIDQEYARSDNCFESYPVGIRDSDSKTIACGYSIERPFGNNFRYSYSFHESTLTRRLHRYCLEYAFLLFSDTRAHPTAVYRMFRLVPCMQNRAKMYPYFKRLVCSKINDPLELPALPLYCIGGAGTHYPVKDHLGNPIYPSNTRLPRRVLGISATRDIGDFSSGQGTQEYLGTFGLDGQWFTCTDVEGYLRDQGVNFDGSSLYADVSCPRSTPNFTVPHQLGNNSPTDTSGLISVHSVPTGRTTVPQVVKRVRPEVFHEGSLRPSAFGRIRFVLDIESFFSRLLRGAIILGRTPGFRLADVESAFKSALLRHQVS